MISTLLQFLASSVLGPLRVGITASKVVEQLGTAFERSVADDGTEIWKYGPLQITLANANLVAVKLDCLAGGALPPPLQDIAIPSPDTTAYAFIDLLDETGVGWEIDSALSFDRQLCILTEGGVRIYFDLDHRELQSLQA
jgi:hypothetical protein